MHFVCTSDFDSLTKFCAWKYFHCLLVLSKSCRTALKDREDRVLTVEQIGQQINVDIKWEGWQSFPSQSTWDEHTIGVARPAIDCSCLTRCWVYLSLSIHVLLACWHCILCICSFVLMPLCLVRLRLSIYLTIIALLTYFYAQYSICLAYFDLKLCKRM